jgi:hypothetical protein
MGAGLSKDGTRKKSPKTVSSGIRLFQFPPNNYKSEQASAWEPSAPVGRKEEW